MNYTKNDFFILDCVYNEGGTNRLDSLSINNIIKSSKLSHTKVRATISMLTSNRYIEEGYMQKNAKTYFITKVGIEFLKNIKEEC